MKKMIRKLLGLQYSESGYILKIFGKKVMLNSTKIALRNISQQNKDLSKTIDGLSEKISALTANKETMEEYFAQIEKRLDEQLRRIIEEKSSDQAAAFKTAIEDNGSQVIGKIENINQKNIESIAALTKANENSEQKRQNSFNDTNSRIESLAKNSYAHFSAFYVGNTGDNLLVKSLRDSIIKTTGVPCNWVDRNVRLELDDDAVMLVNKTNGLFVGGGGLFLKDTNRNDISNWQWPVSINQLDKVKVPLYCLGLGYNRFRGQEDFDEVFYENINCVVERSTIFGMRNRGSVSAIQKYLREDLKEKVTFHPCATTVLSRIYKMPNIKAEKPFIAMNCAFDREDMRFGDKKEEILTALAKTLKVLSKDYEIKYFVHTRTDKNMLPYLDAEKLEYEIVALYEDMSMDRFLEIYSSPALLLAMRGHAQLIPFGCGTPTLSIISHDKLAWFLEDVGHPEWGVDVMDPNFEEKLNKTAKNMLENREQVIQEIEQAKNELWNITTDNLRSLELIDRR